MERDWSAEERLPIRHMLTQADVLSLANALLGLLAIVATANGAIRLPFTLIVLAVLFDGLDGAISRLGYGSGRLGGKLDTLADLVSFVVAPAFLFWQAYGHQAWAADAAGLPTGFATALVVVVACGFFFATGILRLARFDYLKGGDRHDYFLGVTTPAAGTVLASIVLLGWPILPALLALAFVATLMVSRVRLPKLRGSLSHAGGVMLLIAAIIGDGARGLGPILLLSAFVGYLLFGPAYVRRHDEGDEASATLY